MDFKLVSDYTPQGDQGRAIGNRSCAAFSTASNIRFCSASPAQARPIRWLR